MNVESVYPILTGMVGLVTGAGDGIGRACAHRLSSAGATVLVNDVDRQTGSRTAKEIADAGGSAAFFEGDVSSERSVSKMISEIEEQFRAIHILINNAGISLFKDLSSTTEEDWDRVHDVDLKGTYLTTQKTLELLKRAKGAAVINIASVHALSTVHDLTAYAAAKGGVVAMTRSLCQDLGRYGIRVNSICPGFIDTPLLKRWIESTPDTDATRARINSLHPVGRIGLPEDVANAAVFLASNQAGFITGANLVVDGGLLTRLLH